MYLPVAYLMEYIFEQLRSYALPLCLSSSKDVTIKRNDTQDTTNRDSWFQLDCFQEALQCIVCFRWPIVLA
jgi:hypothetical protein